MPLTKSGKSVLKSFEKSYGKKEGESAFYATMNTKKKGTSKWHKTKK